MQLFSARPVVPPSGLLKEVTAEYEALRQELEESRRREVQVASGASGTEEDWDALVPDPGGERAKLIISELKCA